MNGRRCDDCLDSFRSIYGERLDASRHVFFVYVPWLKLVCAECVGWYRRSHVEEVDFEEAERRAA